MNEQCNNFFHVFSFFPLQKRWISCIGDVMLDRLRSGPAKRLSLEGLVPVLRLRFDEDTPLNFVHLIRPKALIKGAGAGFTCSYGKKISLAALEPGYSTANTLKKFLNNHAL